MKRRVVFAGIAVGVVALGAFATRSDSSQYVAADSGDIDDSVTALSVVVPAEGVAHVRARVDGRVVQVYKHSGDSVKAGDLLVRLDDGETQAALDQSLAALAAAKAEAETIRAGARPEERAAAEAELEAHQQALAAAEAEDVRQQKLLRTGSTPSAVAQNAHWTAEGERARVAQAQARLKLALAGGRRTAVEEAAARIRVAEAAVALARENLSKVEIHSPVDGVVLSRGVDPGDTVTGGNMGDVLFEIADVSSLEARIEVEQTDAQRISKGESVDLLADGSSDVVATGKIARVSQQLERRSIGIDDSRVRGDVRVRLAWMPFTPSADHGLFVGERLIAVIHAHKQHAEVRVPRVAVQVTNGHAYVFTRGIFGASKKEVSLGVADAKYVGVTGIDPGTYVVAKSAE